MKLSKPAVFVILTLLFFAALATRGASTDPLDSPYFKGTSAMDYRDAMQVAGGKSLSTRDTKAGHPEGFVPDRVRATGVEHLTGWAYRVARYFSEVDGRVLARRLVAIAASLCVFTMYALASRMWDGQTAGFLAAFLVVFLWPLVGATNGRLFSHTVFAVLLGSLHAAIALRALSARSVAAAIGAALVALALLASWEPAAILLVAWMAPVALSHSIGRSPRAAFVASHAAMLIVAAVVFPHLVAVRALGSWTTAAALACTSAALAPERMRHGWRAAAWIAAGTAVLTVLAMPLRAGAGEQFPAMSYVATRLRFALGRPASPSVLSDWMRSLWSLDHAPLTPHTAIALFLPVSLLALATVWCRSCRERRASFVAGAVVLGVATAAVLLDRSALSIAALAMIPFAAGAGRSLREGPLPRMILLELGMVAAFTGVVFHGGALDPAFQVAKAAGVAYREPYGFTWVSLENTDRELVRFITTRTSVRESILAPDDVSALLLAFTGRTIAQLPGTTSKAPSERHVALTRALFRDEASLYDTCRRLNIDYVLYSIDFLLDAGSYSPRYLAAVEAIDPQSAMVRMHFEPETLQHFTLLYENDHYRLFHVTATQEPVFLTDHPPFYDRAIFEAAGRDLGVFQQKVVELMLTCAEGVNARARGELDAARQRLAWCVGQSPHFTRARLALADVLMDQKRYADARGVIAAVVQYAPDNSTALYYAAYIEVQLDHPDAARPYLTLLFTQERDPEMVDKARALQNYIDRKSPLKPTPPSSG